MGAAVVLTAVTGAQYVLEAMRLRAKALAERGQAG